MVENFVKEILGPSTEITNRCSVGKRGKVGEIEVGLHLRSRWMSSRDE